MTVQQIFDLLIVVGTGATILLAACFSLLMLSVGYFYTFQKGAELERHKETLLLDCKMMLRMLDMVSGHVFDNGVYDPTGTICEGIVLQTKAESRIRANIKAIEGT